MMIDENVAFACPGHSMFIVRPDAGAKTPRAVLETTLHGFDDEPMYKRTSNCRVTGMKVMRKRSIAGGYNKKAFVSVAHFWRALFWC